MGFFFKVTSHIDFCKECRNIARFRSNRTAKHSPFRVKASPVDINKLSLWFCKDTLHIDYVILNE